MDSKIKRRLYYIGLVIVTLVCMIVGTSYHHYMRHRFDYMEEERWEEDRPVEVRPVEEGPVVVTEEESGPSDPAAEFQSLHVYMVSGNVVIQSGDAVVITGAGISSSDATWYQEGPDLYVNGGSGKIVVTVPPMTLALLDVSMGSGDLAVSGISAEELSIYGDSGKVALTDVSLQHGYISTGSGDLGASGLAFSELDIYTGSGKVVLSETKNLESAGIDLSADSGKIVYNGVEGNRFSKLGSDGRRLSVWTESGDIALS